MIRSMFSHYPQALGQAQSVVYVTDIILSHTGGIIPRSLYMIPVYGPLCVLGFSSVTPGQLPALLVTAEDLDANKKQDVINHVDFVGIHSKPAAMPCQIFRQLCSVI